MKSEKLNDLYKDWFLDSINYACSLINIYDALNDKDGTNEFYSENASYLSQSQERLNASTDITRKIISNEELIINFTTTARIVIKLLNYISFEQSQIKYLNESLHKNSQLFSLVELYGIQTLQALSSAPSFSGKLITANKQIIQDDLNGSNQEKPISYFAFTLSYY